MPVDMKGYRVAYGNHVYDCLYVEPIYARCECTDTHFEYPGDLRVHVIDHAAKYAVIFDEAHKFNFLKDGK